MRVRRRPFKDDNRGLCWEYDTYWLIEVDSTADYEVQFETLVHEWCHARLGEEEPNNWHLHSKQFWDTYGPMWRTWYEVD